MQYPARLMTLTGLMDSLVPATGTYVELYVAAGLSCSIGDLHYKYSLLCLWRQTLTVKCPLILKQVVEEQLGRLKVQARPPSRGQVLCNKLQLEAISAAGNTLQVTLVNKCHASAVVQQTERCNVFQWLHMAAFAPRQANNFQALAPNFTTSCVYFVLLSVFMYSTGQWIECPLFGDSNT